MALLITFPWERSTSDRSFPSFVTNATPGHIDAWALGGAGGVVARVVGASPLGAVGDPPQAEERPRVAAPADDDRRPVAGDEDAVDIAHDGPAPPGGHVDGDQTRGVLSPEAGLLRQQAPVVGAEPQPAADVRGRAHPSADGVAVQVPPHQVLPRPDDDKPSVRGHREPVPLLEGVLEQARHPGKFVHPADDPVRVRAHLEPTGSPTLTDEGDPAAVGRHHGVDDLLDGELLSAHRAVESMHEQHCAAHPRPGEDHIAVPTRLKLLDRPQQAGDLSGPGDLDQAVLLLLDLDLHHLWASTARRADR
ncbi:hypothetical protein [Streptomyces sp. SAJ15]|uniref:hypothetical protein n=1 Tax=Streptomyces sp. SAJ15 TaxID=2011095 RepID=UPI001186EE63|nr:hypothetical protein [Streptomyces sp. SAJ15]